MRKRIAAFLLAFVLLPALSGCAKQGQGAEKGKTYDLYYEVRDLNDVCGGDALGKEHTSVETKITKNTGRLARTLLNRLLAGPKTKRLEKTIPDGTILLSLKLNKSHATVNLSASYGSLSGIGLSLADYCITLTLCQIPEIRTVSVTVQGQELAYRDIHDFSASDVLRSSREDVIGTVTVSLYFLRENGTLAEEQRALQLYEGDTQAKSVLQALEKGPENPDLLPVLPDGFTVHSIWTEDDVCYVNLSTAALRKMPENADMETGLRALTRSLCSLRAVNSVQYLVDGKMVSTYDGVNLAKR